MPTYRTPVHARNRAFHLQQGCCYYCCLPMWLEDIDAYRQRYGVTRRQALAFRCTAEHLVARADGGTDPLDNVVAACTLRNRRRHGRPVPLDARSYLLHVRRRLARRRWHSSTVVERLTKQTRGGYIARGAPPGSGATLSATPSSPTSASTWSPGRGSAANP